MLVDDLLREVSRTWQTFELMLRRHLSCQLVGRQNLLPVMLHVGFTGQGHVTVVAFVIFVSGRRLLCYFLTMVQLIALTELGRLGVICRALRSV